ncbi:MAG: hypothetical protein ABL925_15900, partial [Methylococcales bacterium]
MLIRGFFYGLSFVKVKQHVLNRQAFLPVTIIVAFTTIPHSLSSLSCRIRTNQVLQRPIIAVYALGK